MILTDCLKLWKLAADSWYRELFLLPVLQYPFHQGTGKISNHSVPKFESQVARIPEQINKITGHPSKELLQ